jgi:hypothetical protein
MIMSVSLLLGALLLMARVCVSAIATETVLPLSNHHPLLPLLPPYLLGLGRDFLRLLLQPALSFLAPHCCRGSGSRVPVCVGCVYQ